MTATATSSYAGHLYSDAVPILAIPGEDEDVVLVYNLDNAWCLKSESNEEDWRRSYVASCGGTATTC